MAEVAGLQQAYALRERKGCVATFDRSFDITRSDKGQQALKKKSKKENDDIKKHK